MHQQKGFTIVEVVLFLAISSGLAIALFAGTSMAIQRQQYRDSVQSFTTFLKVQYEKVASVENDRTSANKCLIEGADGIDTPSGRGQSNCVIIGRYMQTVGTMNDTDGRTWEARPVYMADVGGVSKYSMGDIDATHKMSWNARTKYSGQPNDSAHIAIMIYRDSETGTVVVRANNGRYSVGNIGNFIRGVNSSGNPYAAETQFNSREICVFDTNWMSGQRMSVFLGARSGSSDAIYADGAGSDCQNA